MTHSPWRDYKICPVVKIKSVNHSFIYTNNICKSSTPLSPYRTSFCTDCTVSMVFSLGPKSGLVSSNKHVHYKSTLWRVLFVKKGWQTPEWQSENFSRVLHSVLKDVTPLIHLVHFPCFWPLFGVRGVSKRTSSWGTDELVSFDRGALQSYGRCRTLK